MYASSPVVTYPNNERYFERTRQAASDRKASLRYAGACWGNNPGNGKSTSVKIVLPIRDIAWSYHDGDVIVTAGAASVCGPSSTFSV